MGAVHSVVLYLEERAAPDSAASHAALLRPLVRLLLVRSFADRLQQNPIFRFVTSSPLYTLIGVVVAYCVFLVFYFPCFLLGLAVTPLGSLLCVVGGVVLLARWVARCMTFPGHTAQYQRQIAQEFLKAFTSQLALCYACSAEVMYAVLVVLSGVPQESSNKRIQFRLKDMMQVTTTVAPYMLSNLERLVEDAAGASPPVFTVPELAALEDLKDALLMLLAQLQTVHAGPLGTALKPMLGAQQTSFAQLQQTLRGLVGDQSATALAAGAVDAAEKFKHALLCIKASEPTDSSPLTSVKRTISSIYTKPVGFERMSFPLMRYSLGDRYSTTRFAVFGPDNNKIDCIFITDGGRGSNDGVEDGSSSARDHFIEAVAGTVPVKLPFRENGAGVALYLNPNAAVYETLSMVPRNGTYVGMYLDMGYDVVLYNYRGYVCSEGTPTPERLSGDGLAVAKHVLRCMHGAASPAATAGDNSGTDSPGRRLIVHGQSLGGMVACHIAANCPAGSVSLLVCDRTFASLDSVAGRMLGAWAGLGLRRLACWRSNSVAAFLNAKCAKIILQDPNDEIIYHSASLKCGVATYLAMKEELWSARRFDRKFLVSAYSGANVPFEDVDSATAALLVRDEPTPSAVEQARDGVLRLISGNGGTVSSTSGGAAGVVDTVVGATRLLQRGLVSATGCDSNTEGFSGTHNSILTECFVQHLAACMLDVYSKTTRQAKINKSADDRDGDSLGRPALAVDPAVREAADAVWTILVKVGADGCGQLLGQAVAKGYDEIRSWVCCFIVWSHISVHDPQLPASAVSVETGLYALKAQLSNMTDSYGPDKQKDSPSRSTAQDESPQLKAFVRVVKFLVDGMEILISLNGEHADLLSEYDDARPDRSTDERNAIRYSRSAGHPTCGTHSLLPLHCGHNGMPAAGEISLLSALIKQKTKSSSGGSY